MAKAGKKDRTDDFAPGAPADSTFDGDRWDRAEDLDELIAFIGIDIREDVETEFGTSDAAEVAYIVTLTGPNKNRVLEDQLIFGAVMAPALFNAVTPSGVVLARLGQGEAKKGRSAPWILEEASKKDHERWMKFAKAYCTRTKSGKIKVAIDEIGF